jgi:hypothetical protein
MQIPRATDARPRIFCCGGSGISRVASSRLPVCEHTHGGRREREQPAHCQQDEPSLHCFHARSLHDAHTKRADVRSFHLAFSV